MKNLKITILGLGYVGLPLAVEFSKQHEVIGFDISESRIIELENGFDKTLELTNFQLNNLPNLIFTSNIDDIKNSDIFIVTVPTPIDENNKPDLSLLINASKAVAKKLKSGNIVIYESTVYPGATEEVCVPVLEEYSGLVFNQDFYCGYSPERISPGEKKYNLKTIIKVTSGSTPKVAQIVDDLYNAIIDVGTHMASSIKVAEAAKVIENTQRDVNIALINELSFIFKKLNIDTEEVLKAAGTKWNFLPFRPGLVGGHCIGVDPYYLTHKSIEAGYRPEMILAGRKLNDSMGAYIAKEIFLLMTKKRIQVIDANVLILGLTFKENCPDIRNTKIIDLVREFQGYNSNVDVYDPWVDKLEVENMYDIKPVVSLKNNFYDAIIVAVSHKEFIELGYKKIKTLGKKNHVLYDIKYVLNANEVDGRL
jgi:UDP-N-acetyl-D-glucosamine/UDP-N-acetyl-D-galactosamine dehydrogenase